MAWEDRNGKRYYYRKRREGGRVISEYVGGGLSGEITETLDRQDRAETEYKRRELRRQKQATAAIDRQVGEVEKYAKAIMQAGLLLAGYHAPKRQWRKRRNE
jgi:hypothetical protein